MDAFRKAVADFANGDPVDWRRVAEQRDLDTVIAGKDAVDQHFAMEEEADAQLERTLAAILGGIA